MDFSEKVFIITGASSGIGGSTSIHLAKLGAKLVLVGRDKHNLSRIALYCEKMLRVHIKPHVIAADVSIDSDAEMIINETIAHFGQLDVLINNAGITQMGGLKNSTMEAYDKVMATNMRAVYHLTMLAVPHLAKTKGCVVNVSCNCSTQPSASTLAYNISKAALDHFTKCVALELAPDGIRVNSVNPLFVQTNLYKNIGLTEDQLDMYIGNCISKTPEKRSVPSDEVAGIIAYLASDTAKDVTGSNLIMDGTV